MIELNSIIFIFLLLLICLTNNAIHALLSLILIFINFAILLFYFDVLFLAFSYILVYIGAICVLFLYIILLLHIRIFNVLNKTNFFGILAIISVSFTFMLSSYFDNMTYITTPFVTFTTDLTLLASYLFESHPVYLLFSMLLLLVALVITVFLSTDYKPSPSFILSNEVPIFININFRPFFNILLFIQTLYLLEVNQLQYQINI